MELVDVLDLEALGGFVTKSVTVEPRAGNPSPRVAEFDGGMINSVGLANPGLQATRRDKLPWLALNVRRARVFVSVAGHTVEEFFQLVEGMDGDDGFVGFELNLSCPNDRDRAGVPFALDPAQVAEIVGVAVPVPSGRCWPSSHRTTRGSASPCAPRPTRGRTGSPS
jgi:dihydroorotate dehydrogenase (NAD+) catalytic subunit